MNYKHILVCLIFIITLTACGSTDESPGFIGYVVKKDDKQILVTSSEVRDYSANGGEKYLYYAYWFSNVPPSIEVGQKVEVWRIKKAVENLLYPGTAKAKKVTILSPTISNTTLTEEEAIRRALASEEIEMARFFIPVIMDVIYDDQASQWVIKITQTGEDKVIEIHVDDKQ